MKIEVKDFNDGCINLFIREADEMTRDNAKKWCSSLGSAHVMVGKMADPMIVTFIKEENFWEAFVAAFSRDSSQKVSTKNTRMVLK
jgi:hypothetical protein